MHDTIDMFKIPLDAATMSAQCWSHASSGISISEYVDVIDTTIIIIPVTIIKIIIIIIGHLPLMVTNNTAVFHDTTQPTSQPRLVEF